MSSAVAWGKSRSSSDERRVAQLSDSYLSDFTPGRHLSIDVRTVAREDVPHNVSLIRSGHLDGAGMREVSGRKSTDAERFFLAAVAKGNLGFRSSWPVGGIDRSHPAVSVQRGEEGDVIAAGYYVARTYRALWAGLLLLALAWGILSGIAFVTGSILSPYAALMGILGTMVLGAALFTAGSRARIRRRKL